MVEHSKIDLADKPLFYEKGVRDFLPVKSTFTFADEIVNICKDLYLQKKVNELSSRGRVLSYNTEQKIVNDGKKAIITFYDFKIKIASDSSENKLLLSDAQRPKDRFDDIVGAEGAKSELQYFINYMKNPKKYMALSIKPPKGILLYGPPGTGKTMLARAMAGECNVTFIPTTAASFSEKYIGEGEKKISQIFNVAKKFAPSIIFIDEIDAIGKERTGSERTAYTEGLLNVLLTEMDGFEVNASKPVFVIAATNYDLDGSVSGKSSVLDEALIRRFDNRIYVDLPKQAEREKYLNILNEKQATTITSNAIHNIAQRTTGESLAILKNIFELCIRNASKEARKACDEDLLNALEEYMYGAKKEWNEDYYKAVSIHESGHAYICYLAGENPSYVTIVSRGKFVGYMQQENEEQIPIYTREDLIWKIRISLAGRAAELEFFGEEKGTNTGISADIQNATNIALRMICNYAMDPNHLISIPINQILNTQKATDILDQVDSILKREMEETRKLIREGKGKIENLSNYLIQYNQAMEKEILDIFQ